MVRWLGTGDKANVYAMRIAFTVPAYWPAVAFGGPVWIVRELAEALAERDHEVHVITTTLVDLQHGLSVRSRHEEIGGVQVHYVGTPVRYRWMGFPAALPPTLRRIGRLDALHLIGYRDPLGLAAGSWALARKIPYLLEPMGMYRPRVRKQRLKRAVDPVLPQPLARRAALVVADSHTEVGDLVEAGVDRERITVRPSPFPPYAPGRTRALRDRIGLGDEPLVLNIGRIAHGKGIELMIEAVRPLAGVHVALVGPNDHPTMAAEVDRLTRDPELAGRLHVLPPTPGVRPLELYGDANVFVLASADKNENFGLVVAEAVSAGVPVVVSEHAGSAELIKDRAGLVVTPTVADVRAAIERILGDGELRAGFRAGGEEVARAYSAAAMAELQEQIYERIRHP